MTALRHLVIGVGLSLCAGVVSHAQEPIKIGTRVGVPASGYDSGGRRDPFASLIKEQPTNVPEADVTRAKGLAGVAVVDAVVTGILTSGQKWIAIVAGPDGNTYLARTNDKLHDAVVRRIDRDSVTFLARVPDGTGTIVSREVKKGLRPTTGAGR